jgi:hypothetical protein
MSASLTEYDKTLTSVHAGQTREPEPVSCLSVTPRNCWTWATRRAGAGRDRWPAGQPAKASPAGRPAKASPAGRPAKASTVTALGAAAMAAVTLLTAQGCAPATDADAVTAASHSVTLAAAREAYRLYLTTSDAAAAQGDRTQAQSVVSSAAWSQVKGQYLALATGTPVPRYRYGTPTFYVPVLAGYPQWFMVAVPRSTVTARRAGTAANTLMLFSRAKKSEPWTLSGSAVLDRPLPAIARNADGYAAAASTTDSALLLRPDVVGATQAAVVDDGPGSPAAAVIGAGPHTTGLHAAQAARAAAERARGLRYQWLLQGAPYPQVGLGLVGGGALVMYGMYLNTINEHPNLVAGAPIPVPAQFTPLLDAPTEVGYHAVYANWTYEFAAIDPPATAPNAKLDVIASQSSPSYGHAY